MKDHAKATKDSVNAENAFGLHVVACSMLQLYVQLNLTGPKVSLDDALNENISELTFTELNKASLDLFERESGEDLEDGFQHVWLLLICRNIWTSLLEKGFLLTVDIWLARLWFMAHRSSKYLSEFVVSRLTRHLEAGEEFISTLDSVLYKEVILRFNLFSALCHQVLRSSSKALEYLNKAQVLTGFSWHMTGQLGKRTKFQRKDVSQLTIETLKSNPVDDSKLAETYDLPENIALDDDTLHDKVQFSDFKLHEASLIDVCILLAHCTQFKYGGASDDLSDEQIMAIVEYILDSPKNFSVQTMALYNRSVLQSKKRRTIERSIQQIEVIIQQFELNTENADLKNRMLYIWEILYSPVPKMKSKLASIYKSLGLLKSAQQIYENLGQWENVALCSVAMQEENRAEKLLNDLIEADPNNPKYHSYMAELKNDEGLWRKSWDISGGRYARAMRCLGWMLLRQKRFKECIECFKKAVAINALHDGVWFSMGCAAMQIEEWETAKEAFSKAASLDPANGECWNNLAAANIRLGLKKDAFKCFVEGLKEKRDSLKMWENFLYLCLDLKEVSYGMNALNRLTGLKWGEKTAIDYQATKVLVTQVFEWKASIMDTTPANRAIGRLEDSLKQLAKANSAKYEIWDVLAYFYELLEDAEAEIDARQSAYRAMNQSIIGERISVDELCLNVAAESLIALAHACKKIPNNQAHNSTRMALRSLMKQGQKNFPDNNYMKQLEQLHEQFQL